MSQAGGSGTVPARKVHELNATDVGEFVRFMSCERRLRLSLDGGRIARDLPFHDRLFNPIDPILSRAGHDAEEVWQEELEANGYRHLDGREPKKKGPGLEKETRLEKLLPMLEALEPETKAFAREVQVDMMVGNFLIRGRLDFLIVEWEGSRPSLRVVEGKASRKDKTYQRIQLAVYKVLLQELLTKTNVVVAAEPIEPSYVSYAVIRIDEGTNRFQSILGLPALDLSIERDDVLRFLAADGVFNRVAACDVEDLDFRIDQKCDTCRFSIHCLPESGRLRKLELVGFAPPVNRVLRENGITTIDELAALDASSPQAEAIRQTDGFSTNLGNLVERAKARRSTLPRGAGDTDYFTVRALKHAGLSQLPCHERNGTRLIRVYLEVNYDYVEKRIGAVAAHVTSSDYHLMTPFSELDHRPEATVVEHRPVPPVEKKRREDRDVDAEKAAAAAARADRRPLRGRDVVHTMTQPWQGDAMHDTASERQILQSFFGDLVGLVAEEAGGRSHVPVHFYVYSRGEMTQLIEACTRCELHGRGASPLRHLRELLGCRQGLEQLIFSCIGEEVHNRFATGWTSRGLSVATSLNWYGQRYHWNREAGGRVHELDRDFVQDIFDFKSSLDLDATGEWAKDIRTAPQPGRVPSMHRFEIRSRFHDTLSAPYWRAVWNTLQAGTSNDARLRNLIERYQQGAAPGVLKSYLMARTQALRWLDERIPDKNDEIEKPALDIAQMSRFRLSTSSAGEAALDFLTLDFHVKLRDWLAVHMQPPSARVQTGKTIPLRDLVVETDTGLLRGTFDLEPFGLTVAELNLRTSFDEGSFVRLARRMRDPEAAQTLKMLTNAGATCRIARVDWSTGTAWLSIVGGGPSTYGLQSLDFCDPKYAPPEFATLDESVTDFVASKVDQRLRAKLNHPTLPWFDPVDPRIPPLAPLADDARTALVDMLRDWKLPGLGSPLSEDQSAAVVAGLDTRMQLLLGPPGTGKTATTAASVIARSFLRHGRGQVILISAHTHLAVDQLVARIVAYRSTFTAAAKARGLPTYDIEIFRAMSSKGDDDQTPAGTVAIYPEGGIKMVKGAKERGILIIAGTPNALIKVVAGLTKGADYKNLPLGFVADALVVDEASMMVSPHSLALTTLIGPEATVMLAGDHLQLAPIVSHDWDREDRPPTVLYQPFRSAYEAMLGIIRSGKVPEAAALRSPLTHTFRLPPEVRLLISEIYRLREDVVLKGKGHQGVEIRPLKDLDDIWVRDHGLLLITHTERASRQSNPVEAAIVRALLDSGLGADCQAANSVALLTPHRAQKGRLQRLRTPNFGHQIGLVDTVERLQGGENETIIVCGTQSDPSAIGDAAEFILNLNRANVAFTRAKKRLIVICAETLLDHMPADLEDYQSAVLWKTLRSLCRNQVLELVVEGARVRVLVPDDEVIAA